MLKPRLVLWMAAAMLPTATMVFGQDYPSKPLRIITASPGGGVEFAARLLAQGLVANMGQQVIVENRGGSGVIAPDIVAKAPADGYTLLSYGSAVWLTPFMRETTYDPVRDFAPISLTTTSPNVLVIHPSLPVKTVKDLIALAKSKPGALNYATVGAGSSSHIAGELFKSMSGTNIVNIRYQGNATALSDVVSGQVQLTFGTVTSVLPLVKVGKLRALAVTSLEPSALAPGLPTVAATGLPGYESVSTAALFAPAKTPAPIINRLHQEAVRILNQADIKQKLFMVGLQTVASTPEQLAAAVKSEMDRIGKVIKEAGIRDQ